MRSLKRPANSEDVRTSKPNLLPSNTGFLVYFIRDGKADLEDGWRAREAACNLGITIRPLSGIDEQPASRSSSKDTLKTELEPTKEHLR